MNMTYLLYTLSARRLLDLSFYQGETPARIEVDLNDAFVYNSVVLSLDAHTDCAYFYQLSRCITQSPNHDRELLKNALVFVDFEGIFSDTRSSGPTDYRKAVEQYLFQRGDEENRGLFITFPGNRTPVRLVPMDKSASMSRSERMSFLDLTYCREMNDRLMLEMDIPGNISLNKLYAYRGLALSSATRMEAEGLVLNEKTVVVIGDDVRDMELPTGSEDQKNIITASPCGTNGEGHTKWEITFQEGSTVQDVNRFDGEGLISFDYARLLQNCLNQPGTYSFQVRLPFGKGMLHTLDFHSIVRDALGGRELSGITVTDAFGVERKLQDAKIILTKSQFKCYPWLKSFAQRNHIDDPMAYYFDKFQKWQHGLYVANTDAMLRSQTKTVSLSYQFLNPMKLRANGADHLKELVLRHFTYADKLRANKLFQQQALLSEETDTHALHPDDTRVSKASETWLQVLHKDLRVAKERKVRGKMEGIYQSRLRDTALGRLQVKGELRFLARDLLSLCFHLAKQCREQGQLLPGLEPFFRELLLSGDGFSMPGKRIPIAAGEKVVLLRNPHLSRNEEWLCRYVETRQRQRYLGHLHGVVEIGYHNPGNLALGGADFDGDLVKCIVDPAVVSAVRDGCYENDCRTVPIIQIPSPGNTLTKPVDHYRMDYETIAATFSSRVGVISNAAILVGYWEYIKGVPAAKDLSPKATILTGLEIDSCKTGDKPDISDITQFTKLHPEHKKKFSYIEAKEALEKMDPVKIQVTESGSGYTIFTTNANRLSIPDMAAGDDSYSHIDRLFWWYAGKKAEIARTPAQSGDAPEAEGGLTQLLPAEKDPGTAKAVNDIIAAYRYVTAKASADHRAQQLYENAHYKESIDDILQLQYDSLDCCLEAQPIAALRTQLLAFFTDIARNTYNEIARTVLKDTQRAAQLTDRMLQWIIRDSWQFMDRPTRQAALRRTYPAISDTQVALLCNFDCDGYRLLYYFIKDAVAATLAGTAAQTAALPEELSLSDAYEDYLSIYSDGIRKKESKAIWHRKLVDAARESLLEVTPDMDTAIRYVYAARNSTDRNGDFFWNVFTADEILTALNKEKEVVEYA